MSGEKMVGRPSVPFGESEERRPKVKDMVSLFEACKDANYTNVQTPAKDEYQRNDRTKNTKGPPPKTILGKKASIRRKPSLRPKPAIKMVDFEGKRVILSNYKSTDLQRTMSPTMANEENSAQSLTPVLPFGNVSRPQPEGSKSLDLSETAGIEATQFNTDSEWEMEPEIKENAKRHLLHVEKALPRSRRKLQRSFKVTQKSRLKIFTAKDESSSDTESWETASNNSCQMTGSVPSDLDTISAPVELTVAGKLSHNSSTSNSMQLSDPHNAHIKDCDTVEGPETNSLPLPPKKYNSRVSSKSRRKYPRQQKSSSISRKTSTEDQSSPDIPPPLPTKQLKPSRSRRSYRKHSGNSTRATRLDNKRSSDAFLLEIMNKDILNPAEEQPPIVPPRLPSRVHFATSSFKSLPNTSMTKQTESLSMVAEVLQEDATGGEKLPQTSSSSSNPYIVVTDDEELEVFSPTAQSSRHSQTFVDDAPLYQTYHTSVVIRGLLGNQIEGFEEEEAIYDDTAIITQYSEHFLASKGPESPKLDDILRQDAGCRTLWSDTPQVKHSGLLSTIPAKDRKIQESLFEIITSEASYLKSLGIIVDFFMMSESLCLESPKCLLSKDEHRHLFSNIKQVRAASQRLLEQLEGVWQELLQMPAKGVCSLLMQFVADSYAAYTIYCANLAFQVREVDRLMKRRDIWDAFKRLQEDPRCGKLPLHSFLNLPMQRVTRLPLLVDQLCQHLGDQHPDYDEARNCLKQLQWMAKICNTKAQQMENLKKIHEIDKMLNWHKLKKIPLVSQGRTIIKEGVLQYVKGTSFVKRLTKKKSAYNVFLFTDWLIVTQKRSNQYFVLIAKRRQFVKPEDVPGNELLLKITFTDEEESYILKAKSISDRTRWVETLDPEAEERIYERADAPQFQVVFSHQAQQSDELTLQPPQVVCVLRKMPDGWFYGYRLPDFAEGWFPGQSLIEIKSSVIKNQNYNRSIRLLSS